MQVAQNERKKVDLLAYVGNDNDSRDKVQEFLDSKGRNSKNTKSGYSYGLKHFNNFLDAKYGYPYTIGNIIDKINNNELDVYKIINNFVSYLISKERKVTNRTIGYYINAVNSYLQFYEVEINPRKFKHRVDIPKAYHEEEYALDREEIREILKACNNRRLKPYLYVLASGGMRANEGLGLRLGDVNFSESPTKVHIRKENKTKTPRNVFISDEATKYLKQWLEWKYRLRRRDTKMRIPEKSDNHLIFTIEVRDSLKKLYPRVNEEFRKVLKLIGLDQRKDESNRGKITLNSFRRFVRTTIADQTNTDYAEWFQGHSGSTYWRKKPEERTEIYKTKCMQALTFLDFTGLVTRTKNMESKLDAKEKEIEELKFTLGNLADQVEDRRKEDDNLAQRLKEMETKVSKSVDYAEILNILPMKIEFDKLTLSQLGTLLTRMHKYKSKSAVPDILENEMKKKGILIDNKLDLKKLASFDTEHKVLGILKKTGMIKKYCVV